MAKRHDAVLEAIDSTVGNAKATKPFRILEIGVYDGNNAVRMIKHAINRGRMNVNYYGVDLFEDLTPAKSKEEMSKTKLPPTMKSVADKIRQVTKGCWLQRGVSYEVIKDNAIRNIPQVDVVFIDGGHSLETIYQDWMAVQPLLHDKTQVVFDDYYHNRDDYGCARLVNFLATDPAYNVMILNQVDKYPTTGLEISCAIVTKVSLYPLNIPNSVRGLPEWSDPPEIKDLLPPTPVTDPAIIEKMEGSDGPTTIPDQGDDNVGHLQTSPGSVPDGGDTQGTDTAEQHSSADGVHGSERGDESGIVGTRGESGNRPGDPDPGNLPDTVSKVGDTGSHDQTSDTTNGVIPVQTGGSEEIRSQP